MHNHKVDTLGHSRAVYHEYKHDKSDSIFFPVVLGLLGGAVLGVVNGIKSNHNFWSKLTAALFAGIIFAVIGCILGLIIGNIIASAKQKKLDDYSRREYKKARNIDNQRVKREEAQRDKLIVICEDTQNRLKESQNKLQLFYNKVGIDQSYRNLVCMGYMNEFVQLGVSNKLDGVDGLYYLVKQELHMAKIELSLEEISAKLDEIIRNQQKIFSEVTQINSKCDTLISNAIENTALLQQSVENTAIAAYNTERIRRENEFQSLMMAMYL